MIKQSLSEILEEEVKTVTDEMTKAAERLRNSNPDHISPEEAVVGILIRYVAENRVFIKNQVRKCVSNSVEMN